MHLSGCLDLHIFFACEKTFLIVGDSCPYFLRLIISYVFNFRVRNYLYA